MKNKKIAYRERFSGGFTLIEMLIVIAVIGILATIIIFSVIGVRQKASATRAKADMTELKKSMEMASIDGCTALSLVVSGSGATVRCTAPTAKDYSTLQTSPGSATYTLSITGGTNSPMTSVNGAAWSAGITGASPTAVFSFATSGFESATNTYTCSPSGCNCSAAAGCATIP